MGQSHSWEANSHWASQEIPCLLWNLKVYYCVHKGLPILKPCVTFCNKLVLYSEELLALCPASKLENHPLSAVWNYLFNISTATLSISGGCLLHSQPKDVPCCGNRDPHNSSIHSFTIYFSKKQFNIISIFIPWPLMWSFPLRLYNQNFALMFISLMCAICPAHLTLLNLI
jgi:hypothetical protein